MGKPAIYKTLFYLSFVLIFSSCEKVIDVDLNNAEKKYVIEAVVTDIAGTAKVKISETGNFDQSNNFPKVSGAIVTVSEVGGSTTTFTEVQPGIYVADNFIGHSGKTYNLSVTIGGKSFTASSTMPQKINMDTLYITNEQLFTDTRKIANVVFDDPAGTRNTYRFIQYVNGLKLNRIMLFNDDYSDGRHIINKLFYFTDDDDDSTKIKSGDIVSIDMLCIDPVIYKYWYSLDRSASGGSGQATPSNPVTNLQGGALGYFSAHTLQSKQAVAQ